MLRAARGVHELGTRPVSEIVGDETGRRTGLLASSRATTVVAHSRDERLRIAVMRRGETLPTTLLPDVIARQLFMPMNGSGHTGGLN